MNNEIDATPPTAVSGIFFSVTSKAWQLVAKFQEILLPLEIESRPYSDSDSNSDNNSAWRDEYLSRQDERYSVASLGTPSTVPSTVVLPAVDFATSGVNDQQFSLVLTRAVSDPDFVKQYIATHPGEIDRLKGLAQAILASPNNRCHNKNFSEDQALSMPERVSRHKSESI